MSDTGLKLKDVKEILNSVVYQDTDGTWKLDLFGEATTQERGKFKKVEDILNHIMDTDRNASSDLKTEILIKPVDDLTKLATAGAITSGVGSSIDAKLNSGINALRLFKLVDNEGGKIVANDNGQTRGAKCVELQPTISADSQVAHGTESIAIGNRNVVYGTNSIVAGADSVCSGTNAIAIGTGATAGSVLGTTNTTALGRLASATGNNATSIGSTSTAPSAECTAIGYLANASGINQVQLGRGFSPAGWNYSVGTPNNGDHARYFISATSSTEDATPREIGFSGSVTRLGDRMVFHDTNGVAPGSLQDEIIAINLQAVVVDSTEAGAGAYSAFLHRRALFRSRDNIVYQLGGTQTIGTDFNFTSGSPNITFAPGPSNTVKMSAVGITGRTLSWHVYGDVSIDKGNIIPD